MSLAPVLPAQVDPPGRSPLVPRAVNDAGVGDDAITIPGEHVLLTRVTLPTVARRERQKAVSAAVADLIADPLDQVHIVQGPELGQGEHLVAVLRHKVMEEWASLADARRARLVPDVLSLPVPPVGSLAVREAGGRVMVRLADRTGFATRTEAFPTFWRAAGRPRIVLFGGQLPPELQISDMQAMPDVPTSEALTFDLMTDRYAPRHGRWRTLKGIAAVAALAVIGHLSILGAEVVALGRIAERHETLWRGETAASSVTPQPSSSQAERQRQANPTAGAPAYGGFLPLLTRISEALPALDPEMVVRKMTFDGNAGRLEMLVEGQDLAALQDLEGRLAAAGLTIHSGTATSSNGRAEMRLVVSGPINGQ